MTGTEGDDFDRLGNAVARVLRDAFTVAEEVRREGHVDAGLLAAQVASSIERSLRDALAVQSHVRREAEEVLDSVRATTASADRAVEEILGAAHREAARLRAEAADEVQALVDRARHTFERANAVVAAERVAFERELGRAVDGLAQAVDALKADTVARRYASLEKARAEAAAILRQARLHHRSTAAEVDRMIEAAASEASALRNAAVEDALRITAEVGAVVEYDGRPVRPVKPAQPKRLRAPREAGRRAG